MDREVDLVVNFIVDDIKNVPCLVVIAYTVVPGWIKGHVGTRVRVIERHLKESSKFYNMDKLQIVNTSEWFTMQISTTCNDLSIRSM